jgi:hypothetical protein
MSSCAQSAEHVDRRQPARARQLRAGRRDDIARTMRAVGPGLNLWVGDAAAFDSPHRFAWPRRSAVICAATRKDTHDCDGQLLVVALESHAPVTDSQPVLV